MSVLLDVRGVTKRFRGLTAVDTVSLSVEEGEIFAVIARTAPARRRSSTSSPE